FVLPAFASLAPKRNRCIMISAPSGLFTRRNHRYGDKEEGRKESGEEDRGEEAREEGREKGCPAGGEEGREEGAGEEGRQESSREEGGPQEGREQETRAAEGRAPADGGRSSSGRAHGSAAYRPGWPLGKDRAAPSAARTCDWSCWSACRGPASRPICANSERRDCLPTKSASCSRT